MNKYKEQALQDILVTHANWMLEGYETREELAQAIANGSYDGGVYVDKNGKTKELARLEIKEREAKYFYSEGAEWLVAQWDVLSRWYENNTEYFDKEISKAMGC